LEKIQYNLIERIENSNEKLILNSFKSNKEKIEALKYLFLRSRPAQICLINKQKIGKLSFKLSKNDFLSLKHVDSIDLSSVLNYPMCMCSLYEQDNRYNSKNQLVICDYSYFSIVKFDNKLKSVKQKITKINSLGDDVELRPLRTESNGSRLLFILNTLDHFVYSIDFEHFNFEKILRNSDTDYLKARDISYSKNRLYAIDYSENKIKIFTSNGDLKENVDLSKYNFKKAMQLGVEDNFMVIGDNYDTIKVIDLSDQTLKLVLNNISYDCFCMQDSKLVILNNSGVLKYYDLKSNINQDNSKNENIKMCFEDLKFDSSSILYFNKKFIICNPWKKKLNILEF
jgi:hypothetical protein